MRKGQYTTDGFGRSVDPRETEIKEKIERMSKNRVSSYDKFFEGYSARVVPKENGKGTKVVRTYTGAVYHQELSPGMHWKIRLLYAVLFICAAAMFIAAITMSTGSNFCWYVVLSSIIPAVFYGVVLLALFLYVFSEQDLKINEYKNGAVRLKTGTIRAVYSLSAVVAATLLMFGLEPGSYSSAELLRLGFVAASGGLVMIINRIEATIKYREIPPEEKKTKNKQENDDD